MKINSQTLTALMAGLTLLITVEGAAHKKRARPKHLLGASEPKNLEAYARFLGDLKTGEPPVGEFPEEETDAPEVEETDAPEVEETDPPAVQETDAPEVEETDPPGFLETDAPNLEGEDGAVPMNDQCVDATLLGPGDSVTASNTYATSEMAVACEDFLGGNVTGLWYKVEGTGSGLEANISADFDMQMAVYRSSGSCDDLICVDGTAGESFPWQDGDIKGASRVQDTYYILVSGWEGASGNFDLSIIEGEVPENSNCSDAPMITLGESVTGTTEFGSIPLQGEFPVCTIDEIFFGITSPTVWYTFEGTGSIVQFSLFSDFDSQISIYEGDNCGNLTCWNSNDDSPILGPQSVIAQPLEEGKMYFINVHGYEKAYGDFTIESEEIQPAENDDCANPTPLELGEYANSDTLAATADPEMTFCGLGSNASSPGVWYSLTGTGNTMQVRLNDTLSLHFSIYTGGCDGLVCAGNQFFGFYPFTWDSVEGEEYLIYVYGRQHALTDTFGIVAEEVERPANDECTDAIPLEVNAIVEGTTLASSTEEGLDFCGDVLGLGQYFGGVWYSFEGTGETRLVGVSSGVGGEGLFDTVVTVYHGSCDELVCIDGNDQGQTYEEFENAILMDTVEGETYYVFVHGYGLSRGDFEIGLLGIPRPENDACGTAEMIEMGDNLEASTEFAQMSDDWEFESCGTSQGGNSSAPGLWYMVEGEGFPVQASFLAQYDAQMTVFSGTCEELTCVDGTEGDENNYFNGKVIWTAEATVMYYILVHGFSGQTGEFELFYETAITRN